jgi:nucleoside phosphorylase
MARESNYWGFEKRGTMKAKPTVRPAKDLPAKKLFRGVEKVSVHIGKGPVPRPIDVLVITALRDELEGVLRAEIRGDVFESLPPSSNDRGRSISLGPWVEYKDSQELPFYSREFLSISGSRFRVAVAELESMGLTAAAGRAAGLARELQPRCIAMAGICAGLRHDVNLGDVIVAERVFQHDLGKYVTSSAKEIDSQLLRDITTHQLDTQWKFFAREFIETDWVKRLADDRPPTLQQQEFLLLKSIKEKRLDARRIPAGRKIINSLMSQSGLIDRKNRQWILTEAGAKEYDLMEAKASFDSGDPVPNAHLAPMASGNQVIANPAILEKIKEAVRKTIAFEMEGSAIGYVAALERIPYVIVVKAVSDFADKAKDDSCRAYACAASAKFLLGFLCNYLPPRTIECIAGMDERTESICLALDGALQNPQKCTIRIDAQFSSLGIPDKQLHNETREQKRLLIEERDKLRQLLRDGATLRLIVHPGSWTANASETLESLQRRRRWLEYCRTMQGYLRSSEEGHRRLEIVHTLDRAHQNFMIIDSQVLFDGRRTNSRNRFDFTIASTDKVLIDFEQQYFDNTFEELLKQQGNGGSTREEQLKKAKGGVLSQLDEYEKTICAWLERQIRNHPEWKKQ